MNYPPRAAIFISLLAAQPVFAQENEVTGIYTSNSLGGNFSMLIISTGLGRVGPAFHGDTEESNLHFKLAISKSEYDTNYDFVSGRGTDNAVRFLLAYGLQLSESTTMRLTGGASNHRISILPVTASSPSDTDKWGVLVAADVYAYLGDKGSLYGLVEYDSAGSNYSMASYVYTFGKFDFGPAISYTSNRDYEHATLGVIGTYKLDKSLELILSVGKIWSRADFSPKEYGNYLDMIFKIRF